MSCPNCPDHDDPRRKPWSVWVGPGEKPFTLQVSPSAGGHVAESDAEWLRELIRTHGPSAPESPTDAPTASTRPDDTHQPHNGQENT